MIKPVVKWAGGKRQLLAKLMDRLPISWKHYYEPFIGGGALLIALYNQGKIDKATISDANPELVNLYQIIQKRPEDLILALKNSEFENDREQYLMQRRTFNHMKGDSSHVVERAALFLYLNRHGYNGLWRVNRKGDFNVPFGRYHIPSFPPSELILGFSQLLACVTIKECDFAEAVKEAQKGDFVYFDPPYYPISPTSRFTSYHENEFSFKDQARLCEVCRSLTKRGVSVMVSNSCTPKIRELYHGFHCEIIDATRSINSRGDRRTGIQELIIRGYVCGNEER